MKGEGRGSTARTSRPRMVSSYCGSRLAAPVDGGQRQHLGHLLDALQIHPLVRGVKVRAHRAVAGGRGVPVEVEETDIRCSRKEELEVVLRTGPLDERARTTELNYGSICSLNRIRAASRSISAAFMRSLTSSLRNTFLMWYLTVS